jgi:putative membrane protein
VSALVTALVTVLPAVAPVLALAAYWHGVQRLWARAGRGHVVSGAQVGAFTAGVLLAAAALAPPAEAAVAVSLVAHMAQHLILVLLVAPLLAFGAPMLPLLTALPRRWRAPAHRLRPSPTTRRRAGAGGAAAACLLHVGVLWVWHVPALYDLAVRTPAVHALEHATMLGTAALLWGTVVSRGGPIRRATPVAALAMFGAATLTVGLAALITLAPGPLYDTYTAARGAEAALADQQLAGALMWSVGGIAYAAAGATLLGLALHRATAADDAATVDGQAGTSASRRPSASVTRRSMPTRSRNARSWDTTSRVPW